LEVPDLRPRSYVETLIRMFAAMTLILVGVLLIQYVSAQYNPFMRLYFGVQAPLVVALGYLMCFVNAYLSRYRALVVDRPFSDELVNEVIIGASHLVYKPIAKTDSEVVLAPGKSMMDTIGPISVKPNGESVSIVIGPVPVLGFIRKRIGGEIGAIPKEQD
jgi:hypothetical protein